MRSTELQELPSISEFYPNYEATIWQGLFAPAGVPQSIIDQVRKEVSAILESKVFADKLAKTGPGEPYITSLEEFKTRIHQHFERYGQIVKAAAAQVHWADDFWIKRGWSFRKGRGLRAFGPTAAEPTSWFPRMKASIYHRLVTKRIAARLSA
jgi:Tripartite tricarboxylate transporter family receptor